MGARKLNQWMKLRESSAACRIWWMGRAVVLELRRRLVDHDTARVVWMADGHGTEVLTRFFDQLGEQRAALLTHISADGAAWIAQVIADRAPGAAGDGPLSRRWARPSCRPGGAGARAAGRRVP
jgi:hypothetical protein